MTTPSTGIFAPGLTTTRSPTCKSLVKMRSSCAIFEPPAADREDLDDLANRPPGAVKRERFETFAEHADEDDLGRHQPFLDENGGEKSDGDGEIGADLLVEQPVQRHVDDPCPPKIAAIVAKVMRKPKTVPSSRGTTCRKVKPVQSPKRGNRSRASNTASSPVIR